MAFQEGGINEIIPMELTARDRIGLSANYTEASEREQPLTIAPHKRPLLPYWAPRQGIHVLRRAHNDTGRCSAEANDELGTRFFPFKREVEIFSGGATSD